MLTYVYYTKGTNLPILTYLCWLHTYLCDLTYLNLPMLTTHLPMLTTQRALHTGLSRQDFRDRTLETGLSRQDFGDRTLEKWMPVWRIQIGRSRQRASPGWGCSTTCTSPSAPLSGHIWRWRALWAWRCGPWSLRSCPATASACRGVFSLVRGV
jgi:hypothetical protein